MKTVILHGLGQTPASWSGVIDELTGECFCPSLPGLLCGGNTYGKLYSALVAYCGRFSEPVNLCGLSLGAVLALQYGLEHPEKVGSLALIAPQYKMPKALLAAQNALFRLMPGSAFGGMGFDKNTFISLCRSMRDINFEPRLGSMRCRTLILCGENDKANIKAARKLHGLLPGSEFAVIQNSGHEANKDAAGTLAQRLNEFFA